jgi:hypothetical protein
MPLPTKELYTILKTFKGIRHGWANLIIQDGFVIQVDRYEKFRLK